MKKEKQKIKSVEYHTRLIEDLDCGIKTSENINETAQNVLTTSLKAKILPKTLKKLFDQGKLRN